MRRIIRNLLWVDGIGAAVAGVAVLLLSSWLSPWYQLPRQFVLFVGAVNLAYATYSLSLAQRSERPMALIRLLVIGNLAWALTLIRWTFVYWESASFFGLAHLVGEALYVGGLGCLEWRWRESLRFADDGERPKLGAALLCLFLLGCQPTAREMGEIIDGFAGHPHDLALPQSAPGVTDEVLMGKDSAEVARFLDETESFAQEGSASPRHLFALGRVAYLFGYDERAKRYLTQAEDEGSAAASAYLGYLFAEKADFHSARVYWEKAQQAGFNPPAVERALKGVEMNHQMAGTDGTTTVPNGVSRSLPIPRAERPSDRP